MHFSEVQCISVPFSTVLCSSVLFSIVQHILVRFSTETVKSVAPLTFVDQKIASVILRRDRVAPLVKDPPQLNFISRQNRPICIPVNKTKKKQSNDLKILLELKFPQLGEISDKKNQFHLYR